MPAEYPYLIGLGSIPQWMVGLPERENFKEIKDAIRHAVKRSGAAILDPVPRVHLRDGLAWFEVEDYDDALTTQHILQGHYWRGQGIVLDAYMFQQDGYGLAQLRGPVNSATGKMLAAPVPRSPPRVSVSHRHRGCTVPTGYQPRNVRPSPAGSSNYGPGSRDVQRLPTCVSNSFDRLGRAPTNSPTGYAGINYPRIQQAGPMTPVFSSSSRNSSISTLSTMKIAPDLANPVDSPAFSTTSSTLETPLGSRNPSISNDSVASSKSRSGGPILTPPPSVSEYGSEPPSPASVHGYKVTIRNLSQEATKEGVYALVEERTHAYVQMVQPEYIKLRQVHGQLHAYVEFIREKDAKKAVRQLHGHQLVGRTLQATLG